MPSRSCSRPRAFESERLAGERLDDVSAPRASDRGAPRTSVAGSTDDVPAYSLDDGRMNGHLARTSLGFLLALALGGAAAALLTAVGAGGAWPIIAGWLVFFATGIMVGRRLHRER
jgi:hypothetical protein